MATEKRLIDANDLLAEIEIVYQEHYVRSYDKAVHDIFNAIRRRINRASTVDAVEVVRCKECKKWFRHTEVDRERGECRRYQTTKHETGFCDRGERKDNV